MFYNPLAHETMRFSQRWPSCIHSHDVWVSEGDSATPDQVTGSGSVRPQIVAKCSTTMPSRRRRTIAVVTLEKDRSSMSGALEARIIHAALPTLTPVDFSTPNRCLLSMMMQPVNHPHPRPSPPPHHPLPPLHPYTPLHSPQLLAML